MERITTKQLDEIAEELRVTRYKGTTERAYDYIFDKHKDLFFNKDQFLHLMQICALFWSCQYENPEDMIAHRENTVYVYVEQKTKQLMKKYLHYVVNDGTSCYVIPCDELSDIDSDTKEKKGFNNLDEAQKHADKLNNEIQTGDIAILKKSTKDMAYIVSLPLHTTEAEARDYLKGFVWGDCETEETNLNPHTKHIESFEGVDMYLDSYLGSYIFIDNPQGV